jgi:hypothetical protein
MKTVKKQICFNGQLVETVGKIICSIYVATHEYYVVDFTHDGVEFRGLWDIREVECS